MKACKATTKVKREARERVCIILTRSTREKLAELSVARDCSQSDVVRDLIRRAS